MKRIQKFTSLILALSFSVAVQASFDRAMEFYHAEDYERAYSLFESYAAIGNGGAQFNIAVMHYKGQLQKSDAVKAYAWMALAGETTGEASHVKLSKAIYDKLPTDKKLLATNELDLLRAKYGNDAIASFIKPVLLDDEDCTNGVEKIHHVTAKYPRRRLNLGKMGIVELEYTIWKDGSVRDVQVISSDHKDFTMAAVNAVSQWKYKVPMAMGKPFTVYNNRLVTRFILKGAEGDTKKITDFLDGLKVKAEQGDPVYQYYYAENIAKVTTYAKNLKGFDYQDQDSNKWFYKAAQGGVVEAQYKIGRNQYYGKGCLENKEAGMRWLLKSASGGYAEAQYLMALEFLKDSDLVYHEDESVMWLESSAAKKFGPAQAKLAWLYATAKEERFYQPEKSSELLEQNIEGYYDDIFIYETKAASYAANGEYKKAVKYQEKAISEAEEFDRDLGVLNERLLAYKSGKAWRQSIHSL